MTYHDCFSFLKKKTKWIILETASFFHFSAAITTYKAKRPVIFYLHMHIYKMFESCLIVGNKKLIYYESRVLIHDFHMVGHPHYHVPNILVAFPLFMSDLSCLKTQYVVLWFHRIQLIQHHQSLKL